MTTWLDAARRFSAARNLGEDPLHVLGCFAGPMPRGGPPPPPEQPWDGDFEGFERLRLADSLDDVAAMLTGEVDEPQAQMFARRLRAVDAAIAALDDDVGRLYRVGLRQRVRTIVAAPQARATRIRALADFYYSYVGLHRHHREAADHPSLEQRVAAASWSAVAPGVAYARLDGPSDMGPLHVNLLRLDPAQVRLQVEDLRPQVARGVGFADHVQHRGALAGISGGFFLYSESDIAPPSARYDPVGLLMEAGRVLSPPCFRRGALLVGADGRLAIDRVGMTDVEIVAPDGTRWRPDGVFNRAQGRQGPDEPSAAVVGHTVVAVGRALAVPLNGYILPLPPGVPLQPGDRLEYPTVHGPRGPLALGIAGGPLLLRDGEPVLDMRAEDFWELAPPVTFSQDETGDRNLLPRLAAGLTPEGMLVLVAIDGRNFQRALGMTLGGVARLLRTLGCTRATNLDGGSSKRMAVRDRAVDLATTEIVNDRSKADAVRPVHTAVLIFADALG